MRYLLILLLLVSCGKNEALPPPDFFIDPAFTFYYQTFLMEAKKRNVVVDKKVSIVFGDLEIFDGYCYTDSSQVVIDRTRWLDLDEEKKELLILHELGHCVLKKTHEDESEIMQTTFYFLDYKNLKNYYLNKFFGVSLKFYLK